MATKLNTGGTAPAVAVGLLLATCLLLAATGADASRPLMVSSEGTANGAQQTVEPPPVGYVIQTVVVGTAEQDGAGATGAGHSRLMDIDMLGGMKPEGPSPGDGH